MSTSIVQTSNSCDRLSTVETLGSSTWTEVAVVQTTDKEEAFDGRDGTERAMIPWEDRVVGLAEQRDGEGGSVSNEDRGCGLEQTDRAKNMTSVATCSDWRRNPRNCLRPCIRSVVHHALSVIFTSFNSRNPNGQMHRYVEGQYV